MEYRGVEDARRRAARSIGRAGPVTRSVFLWLAAVVVSTLVVGILPSETPGALRLLSGSSGLVVFLALFVFYLVRWPRNRQIQQYACAMDWLAREAGNEERDWRSVAAELGPKGMPITDDPVAMEDHLRMWIHRRFWREGPAFEEAMPSSPIDKGRHFWEIREYLLGLDRRV